jgi:hypothetical protein
VVYRDQAVAITVAHHIEFELFVTAFKPTIECRAGADDESKCESHLSCENTFQQSALSESKKDAGRTNYAEEYGKSIVLSAFFRELRAFRVLYLVRQLRRLLALAGVFIYPPIFFIRLNLYSPPRREVRLLQIRLQHRFREAV